MAAKKQYYSQAGAMSKPKEVTVKKGDTLWGISKSSGASGKSNSQIASDVQRIAKRSGISDPNKIQPGQKIKVDRPMTTAQGKTGPSTKRGTANYSPGAEAIARSKKSSSSTSSGGSKKSSAGTSSSGYTTGATASAAKARAAAGAVSNAKKSQNTVNRNAKGGSISSSGYGTGSTSAARAANKAKTGTPNTRTNPSRKASSYAKG